MEINFAKEQKQHEIEEKSMNFPECEDFNEFKRIVKLKKVKLEHFNIYKKIKKENSISPLMIFILEKAIDKYNNMTDGNDIGLETVGFGYFPGISNQEKENNKAYFNSNDAFVLYASFSEKLLGIFWSNHQLLADLLSVNPDKSVLSSKLKLTTSKINKSKANDSQKSNSKQKSSSSQNSEMEQNKNNKEFHKFSLGENFEYNSLVFLLYGIQEYINLPRIIFYPLVEYQDYEEIDNAFEVKEMKTNINLYYSNFKSINLDDYKNNRKEFKLEVNDLVFVEATFEIDSKKDKVLAFMKKIIKFIDLYINEGLIEELNKYKIKPIILYDNDYYLREKDIDNIKSAINEIKEIIKKRNNEKLCEIYDNLQIIYCWPTMPIFNNVTSYNDLNTEIKYLNKEIKYLKNNDELLRKELKELKSKIINNNTNKKRKYYTKNYKKNYNNKSTYYKINNNNNRNYKRFPYNEFNVNNINNNRRINSNNYFYHSYYYNNYYYY